MEMRVVGFNLKKISAERKKGSGKINIKMNISIENIEKTEIDMGKGKDVLAFDFSFTLDYQEEIAEFKFSGELLILFENKKAKKILEEWKDKKIDEEIRMNIYNFIFLKCSLKALQLEEELGLPFHIRMPFLKEKPEKKE